MTKASDAAPDQSADTGLDPQEVARLVGEQLTHGSLAAETMGITLTEIAPGSAAMQMTVTPEMANGAGVCHGGIIFTLADTCGAYASASYGKQSLAFQGSINWVKGANVGDVLTARAREVAISGKTGVYDINVTNQDDVLVAVMRFIVRFINLPAYQSREEIAGKE